MEILSMQMPLAELLHENLVQKIVLFLYPMVLHPMVQDNLDLVT